MRKTTSIFIVLLACVLLFNLNDLNSGSLQKKKGQKDLEHEAVVTLKLVQVYVTDKKGNPIMDLKKDDFELYDNGKIKKITEFEKHALAAPSDETIPKPATRRKLNRKFFLFFDFAFNTSIGIKNSRKAALHFIDTQLLPTDEVGLLSYSAMKDLTLHENLTTEHQKVREVVEGFGVKTVLGRAENVELKYWGIVDEIKQLEVASMLEAQDPESSEEQQNLFEQMQRDKETELSEMKFSRNIFKQQITLFCDTIIDMAAALSTVSGYKNIVFFSSGIPSSMFEGMPKDTIQTRHGKEFAPGTFGDPVLREKYERMIKELDASNSSVYTVYSEGAGSAVDFDRGMVDRQMLGISSLQKLSGDTGGKYYGNVLEYENIMGEIHDITGSFYVLGYYVDESWDGKYHKINVKINRKGTEVLAQKGYFNPKPFSKFSKLEKMIHFINLALEEKTPTQTPHRFQLTVLPCMVKGESSLVMISKIPLEEIQKISGKKVEIANCIFDDQGEALEIKRFVADFSKFQKKDMYYYSLSALSPGKYIYRVIMRNMENGESAISSSPVTIAQAPESGIKLNPPLLLNIEKDGFYVKGTLIEKKEKGAKPIGLFDAYPFNLKECTPIIKDAPQGTSQLIVVLHCSTFNVQQPEFQPFARLIYLTGGMKIPMNISLVHKQEEADAQILLLGLQMDALKPGKYRLDLMVRETKTRAESEAKTSFSVK